MGCSGVGNIERNRGDVRVQHTGHGTAVFPPGGRAVSAAELDAMDSLGSGGHGGRLTSVHEGARLAVDRAHRRSQRLDRMAPVLFNRQLYPAFQQPIVHFWF